MVQSALPGLPCYLLQSPSRDRSSLPPYPTCCPISFPRTAACLCRTASCLKTASMENCSRFQNHISHRGDPSCHLLADHFSHAPSRNKIIRYHMPPSRVLSSFSAFEFSFFWASGYTRSHEPFCYSRRIRTPLHGLGCHVQSPSR